MLAWWGIGLSTLCDILDICYIMRVPHKDFWVSASRWQSKKRHTNIWILKVYIFFFEKYSIHTAFQKVLEIYQVPTMINSSKIITNIDTFKLINHYINHSTTPKKSMSVLDWGHDLSQIM